MCVNSSLIVTHPLSADAHVVRSFLCKFDYRRKRSRSDAFSSFYTYTETIKYRDPPPSTSIINGITNIGLILTTSCLWIYDHSTLSFPARERDKVEFPHSFTVVVANPKELDNHIKVIRRLRMSVGCQRQSAANAWLQIPLLTGN